MYLSYLYEWYSEEGNPPYHTMMILKVLFYAYHKGLMSCRKVWDAVNMLATASARAVIAIFDAICIALMEYTDYTKEQFAVIHPGGEVEEQLLKEKQQKGMRG